MTIPDTCIAFSGYRPNKYPFRFERGDAGYERLKKALEDAVVQAIEDGFTTFLCGGAMGLDILAGEIINTLQDEGMLIRLICVVPFAGQAKRWTWRWKDRYCALLRRADDVVTLSEEYHDGCYHERNRFLVEHSSRLIVYYDGQPGGTQYTVEYAKKREREIVNLCDWAEGDLL